VATVAHELGHARLLGEERVTGDRPDGEPLTDLATVYLDTNPRVYMKQGLRYLRRDATARAALGAA
jgi:hypothetical protein